MLVVMEQGATEEQIRRVVEQIGALGCTAEPIPGGMRTAVCVLHNRGAIDPRIFEVMPGVKEAIRVSKPYKLVSRETHPEETVVRVGKATIGGHGAFAIIAGPCSVENEEQILAVARSVKEAGADILRGGAYKPRTSPYAFQGLGEEGLRLLALAREETGLPVATEAIDHEVVDLVERHADVIQIGARNMQNYTLLKRVGRSRLPVILKRGLSATVEEWLMAAEYVMSEGNRNVILCERGVRTFADHLRNTLDLSAVPYVQRISHLPVIVDPSHASGVREFVPALAYAGAAVGADGMMVEVHHEPERALSDGPQALLPETFEALVPGVREVAARVRALRVGGGASLARSA